MIYFLYSIWIWIVGRTVRKRKKEMGFIVELCCENLRLIVLAFCINIDTNLFVGVFILQSVSKKITHRKTWKQGLFLWFFHPHNTKKSIFFGMWYNTIVERERQRERATRTKSKKSIAFNPWYNKSVKGNSPNRRKARRHVFIDNKIGVSETG